MKNNVSNFTVPEKILLSADHLEKQGQTPFTAEALIVASWKKFPRTFGLKGFADLYPDSNKILSSIMGEKGLARRGWLNKLGQKVYALSKEGKRVVSRVKLQEDNAKVARPVKIARDQEKFLITLLDSSANQKYEENRKNELTFADACRFWGITENLKGDALDKRMTAFQSNLGKLEETIGAADGQMSIGRVVTPGDVRVLTNLHRFMEDRFERHMNVLRAREVKV